MGYNSLKHSALTDEEMICQVLPTQPGQCFELLYNRYVTKVYQRCLSMSKDPVKAQDFTQDIFLKVFGKLDTFQQRSSFSTWLYSISYNYCLDQLRSGKVTPTISIDTIPQIDIADIQESQLREEAIILMGKAMKMLSADEQRLLKLKYEDSLSVEEIAQLYSIKSSAVKMRLKRSRDKIRLLHNQLWGG
jgi:RNA polymerase sigma-70 factor (ECF subfamily)